MAFFAGEPGTDDSDSEDGYFDYEDASGLDEPISVTYPSFEARLAALERASASSDVEYVLPLFPLLAPLH
jgi:hypothetical protein